MEYRFIIYICLLFTGVSAFLANIKPIHKCGEHHCDNHNRYCRVRHIPSFANIFDCVDEMGCSKACGSPDDPTGCCCLDQPCVDTFRHNQSNGVTYYGHIDTGPLSCLNCHDIGHCDMTLHHCHEDHDVCMIRQTEHPNVVEAKCIKKDECNRHWRDDARQHNRPEPSCCVDNNCTYSSLQHYKTGTYHGLHCPLCYDMLGKDCFGDFACHHGEVCMIRHIDQRVETRCIQDKACQHFVHEMFEHPERLTICCHDLHCSHATFSQLKLVNIGSGISGTNSNTMTLAPTKQSSFIGSSICTDNEDATFKCADYVRAFDICNKVNGTGLVLATKRCQKTCGLCQVAPLSIAYTNTAATQAPSTITTVQPTTTTTFVQTSAASTSTIQHPTSIQSPTTGATSTGLASSGANQTCVDHDVNNGCAAYIFYFCPAKSGYAKDFAIRNCAKTCNRCDEYYALLQSQTQSGNFVPIMG